MVTRIVPHEDHTEVILPSGARVIGYPQDDPTHQREVARRLGYEEDVLAMVLDHDPLHVYLSGWLGFTSYSMRLKAGELSSEETFLAEAEEEAVLAVQRLARLVRNRR